MGYDSFPNTLQSPEVKRFVVLAVANFPSYGQSQSQEFTLYSSISSHAMFIGNNYSAISESFYLEVYFSIK